MDYPIDSGFDHLEDLLSGLLNSEDAVYHLSAEDNAEIENLLYGDKHEVTHISSNISRDKQPPIRHRSNVSKKSFTYDLEQPLVSKAPKGRVYRESFIDRLKKAFQRSGKSVRDFVKDLFKKPHDASGYRLLPELDREPISVVGDVEMRPIRMPESAEGVYRQSASAAERVTTIADEAGDLLKKLSRAKNAAEAERLIAAKEVEDATAAVKNASTLQARVRALDRKTIADSNLKIKTSSAESADRAYIEMKNVSGARISDSASAGNTLRQRTGGNVVRETPSTEVRVRPSTFEIETSEIARAGRAGELVREGARGIGVSLDSAAASARTALRTAKAFLTTTEGLGFLMASLDVALFIGFTVADYVEEYKKSMDDLDHAEPFRNAANFSEEYRADVESYYAEQVKDFAKGDKSVPTTIGEKFRHDQRFWDGFQASMMSASKEQQEFYDKFMHVVKKDDAPVTRVFDYRDWNNPYSYKKTSLDPHTGVRMEEKSMGALMRDKSSAYKRPKGSSMYSFGTTDKRLEAHRIQQVKSDPKFIQLMYRLALGTDIEKDIIAYKKDGKIPVQNEYEFTLGFNMIDRKGRVIKVVAQRQGQDWGNGQFNPKGRQYQTGVYFATADDKPISDTEFIDLITSDDTYGEVIGEQYKSGFTRDRDSFESRAKVDAFKNVTTFMYDHFGNRSGDLTSQYILDWYTVNKDAYFDADVEAYNKANNIPTETIITDLAQFQPKPQDGSEDIEKSDGIINPEKTVNKPTDESSGVTGNTDVDDGMDMMMDSPFDIKDMCTAWATVCYWSNQGSNIKAYYSSWVSEQHDIVVHFMDQSTGILVGLSSEIVEGIKRVYITVNDFDMFAPHLNQTDASPTHMDDYQYNTGLAINEEEGSKVNHTLLRLSRKLMSQLHTLFIDAGDMGKVQRVAFCGRGCGGALAALFAIDPQVREWVSSITEAESIHSMDSDLSTHHYGFSMPRFANNKFASHAMREHFIRFYRVSLDNDTITRYPLLHSSYVHFGEEWVLHDDGSYTSIIGDGTKLSRVIEKVPFTLVATSVHNYFADSYGKMTKMQNSLKNMVARMSELHGMSVGGVEFMHYGNAAKSLPSVRAHSEADPYSAYEIQKEISTMRNSIRRGGITPEHLDEYVSVLGKRRHSSSVDKRMLKAHIIEFAHSQRNPANKHRGVSFI